MWFDWIASDRSYPGAPRFPKLTTVGMVESRIERGDKIETERRSYISSRVLSAAAFAEVVRGHWAIENNLHWSLDVTFNEDRSRPRAGHGAKNMAVVRHFALPLPTQRTTRARRSPRSHGCIFAGHLSSSTSGTLWRQHDHRYRQLRTCDRNTRASPGRRQDDRGRQGADHGGGRAALADEG
jgi:predicted transposase YbfD/YdcC